MCFILLDTHNALHCVFSMWYREEKRNAEMLQAQMAEVKQREEEAAMLEQQRDALLQQQWQLEEAVRTLPG